MKVTIVLIHGEMGAGKDEFALHMGRAVRSTSHSMPIFCVKFADCLKQICSIMSGISLKAQDKWKGIASESVWDFTREDKETFLPTWNMTLREMLQKVGTEVLRDTFDKDTHVKALVTDIDFKAHVYSKGEDQVFIVPDTRFYNELELENHLDAAGIDYVVKKVKVVRPDNPYSAQGIKGHSSEQVLEGDWDLVVVNDKDLEHLYGCAEVAVKSMVTN